MRLISTLFAALLLVAACGNEESTGIAQTGIPAPDDATQADDHADGDHGDDAEGRSVRIASPADGALVTSPVDIVMEAVDFTIEEAGEVHDGAGHFHLMVDVGCVEVGEVIPGDTDGFNHFGGGQTEATLELDEGEHTICLQVGDGVHTALDLTHEITVTVVDELPEPSVEITSPADGAEVTSPFVVEMAATGFTIEEAGEVHDGAGHFHLMVDVGCVEVGEVIPGDTDGFNHFGDGSVEVELELEPGTYELCLQAGDGIHTALDITHEITITVTEG